MAAQKALARVQESPSILQVIGRAAADPNVNVEKMQALLDMQMQISAKQAEMAYNADMARMQPLLPRIMRNGVIQNKAGGVQSRYSRFEDIDKSVRPILAEHGFALNFGTAPDKPNCIGATCTIRHREGHSETNTLYVPIDTSGSKNSVQGVVSSLSYAKRTLLRMMLNIVDETEDNPQGEPQKPISEQHLMTLNDMLEATGADKQKFMRWANVAQLADLTEDGYERAMQALKEKAKK